MHWPSYNWREEYDAWVSAQADKRRQKNMDLPSDLRYILAAPRTPEELGVKRKPKGGKAK